jgi:hypothetical protein
VQYGGLGGRFRDIRRADLLTDLPEGDARTFATCLAERRDIVDGKSLAGGTWTFERAEYFTLEVNVGPRPEFRDPVMVFVFDVDGRQAFQALAWDRKHRVKLNFENRSPYASP